MSYIRNTSNPESLYIWDDGVWVNFQWNTIENTLTMANHASVKREHFLQLLNEYSKPNYNDTPIEVDELKFNPPEFEDEIKYKLRFTNYVDVEIEMWRVTWECVVNEHRRKRFYSKWERLKFYFNRLNW